MLWWGAIGFRPIELFLATAKIGVGFAPVSSAFSDVEMAPLLEYLRPRLLVTDPERAERAESLLAGTGIEVAVVGLDGASAPGQDFDVLAAAASTTLPDVEIAENDIHPIFLTSGSTGMPKGACITQATQWIRTLGGTRLGGGRRGFVNMFPLFHYAGYSFFMKGWIERRTVHLVESADAETLLHTVERWGADAMYCIPAVWERVLGCAAQFDTSTLRAVPTGTSLVTVELLQALKERFPGSTTTISYGATEIGGGLTLEDDDLFAKPRSVGMPTPGLRARIDESGELLMTGATLMAGYLDRPAETAAALDGGWYRTGDLALVDDDGYYWITGRKKEALRSGGEWISPPEVEAALLTHPAVREVAIVGLDDERWGELVCAIVVPREPGSPPTVDVLRAHLDGVLARYKHPRVVLMIDALPRTGATGQIQRTRLKAWAQANRPG